MWPSTTVRDTISNILRERGLTTIFANPSSEISCSPARAGAPRGSLGLGLARSRARDERGARARPARRPGWATRSRARRKGARSSVSSCGRRTAAILRRARPVPRPAEGLGQSKSSGRVLQAPDLPRLPRSPHARPALRGAVNSAIARRRPAVRAPKQAALRDAGRPRRGRGVRRAARGRREPGALVRSSGRPVGRARERSPRHGVGGRRSRPARPPAVRRVPLPARARQLAGHNVILSIRILRQYACVRPAATARPSASSPTTRTRRAAAQRTWRCSPRPPPACRLLADAAGHHLAGRPSGARPPAPASPR